MSMLASETPDDPRPMLRHLAEQLLPVEPGRGELANRLRGSLDASTYDPLVYDDLDTVLSTLRDASDVWLGVSCGMGLSSDEHVNPWPVIQGNWPLVLVASPLSQVDEGIANLPRAGGEDSWGRARRAYHRLSPWDFAPDVRWATWYGLLAPTEIAGGTTWQRNHYDEPDRAWIGGLLCAFAVIDSGRVGHIWTAIDRRRRGYATALVRAIEDLYGKKLEVPGPFSDLGGQWAEGFDARAIRGLPVVVRLDRRMRPILHE